MIRRVNLYGGPCCAKSVTAARLFAELNLVREDGRRLFSVEHVQEYVKTWAYQDRKPQSFDQFYLLAKQMHREDVLLRYVGQVVTDSPLLLGSVYAKECGFKGWKKIVELAMMFEESFPSINIILDRTGIEYDPNGRYQTLDDAVRIDRLISDMVYAYSPHRSVHVLPALDFEAIKSLVVAAIGRE